MTNQLQRGSGRQSDLSVTLGRRYPAGLLAKAGGLTARASRDNAAGIIVLATVP